MLKIKFKNASQIIEAEFATQIVNGHTVVQLVGNIPKNKSGFEVLREEGDILGDYSFFTSIYKELKNGLQFSEPGLDSWMPPEPMPEPADPTPEEIAGQERQEQILNLNSKIGVLKKKIDATDYKIIKCYEYGSVGLESPYDSTALHEERQVFRDVINELELEIAAIS